MMEATLVSASMGVMKPLLSKLTKVLGHEYVKLKGTTKQIEFLRDELSAMSATLQMLEDAEELNPQMKDWRDKLRELAYDTEDCIDAFMARADLGHDAPTGFRRKLKKLKATRGIADEIEDLKARAVVAGERHKRYSFGDPASFYRISSCAIDPRLPALYEEFNNLVGINGSISHIIEWLEMDSIEIFKVLPVAGCGGLGKTTLANQVYHTIKSKFFHERESQFFCTAFVTVSRNPNVRKILRDIAEEVGITDISPIDDERQLINKLRKHLQDKRYFVVVDDVWEAEAWEAIRLALFNNRRGSRIIMTTRNLAVASCCSSDGKVYQMEGLSFADSKMLFCKRAFGSEELCCPHLTKVCDSILEKCGGLPLAIITISSLLADQLAIEEWNRVLTAIGHALAKDPGAWKMTKILCLSYFDLPHQLRSCWLYLSTFPEDHEINKQHLISRWIAEGFIYEKDGHSKCEVGELYFNDLINRSLIQAVDVQYGQARACRIHDIILDFITCKAAEENFIISSLDDAQRGHISDCRIRRVCVDNRNETEISTWSGLILSHIRSLTVYGQAMEPPFLAFTTLRVLDLADCWGMQDHHLANIGRLYQLKYLNLGSDLITTLPGKIGELQYLETLDIQGTSIVELPSTITKLQRLSRLYIDPHTSFPDGSIGKMKSLEELKEFGICSYKVGKTLQEFSELTNLRRLSVSWRFDWPDDFEGSQAEDLYSSLGTLVSSCRLHHLDIVRSHYAFPIFDSLDSWNPVAPSSLHKLHISFFLIYKAPNWMTSLENLKELELGIFSMGPEDVEILGSIPCLVFLELITYRGSDGRMVIPGNNRFRSLKYFSLVIAICGTALEFEAGSMPKVEHFKFRFCVHKMDCLNGVSNLGIQHLSTLTKVEVDMRGYCNYDDNYYPWVERDEDDDIVKYVASTIKSAVETLPNNPTIRFKTIRDRDCTLQRRYRWRD